MRTIVLKTKEDRNFLYRQLFNLTKSETNILVKLIDNMFNDGVGYTFKRQNIEEANGKKYNTFNNMLVELRKKKVLGTTKGLNYIPDYVLSNESFLIKIEDNAKI